MPLQKAGVDLVWPALDGRSNCFDIPNGEVYGGIRVNLVGREPQGKIKPGVEYDAFCDALTRDLCALAIGADGAAWAGAAQARLLRREVDSWVRMSGDLGIVPRIVDDRVALVRADGPPRVVREITR